MSERIESLTMLRRQILPDVSGVQRSPVSPAAILKAAADKQAAERRGAGKKGKKQPQRPCGALVANLRSNPLSGPA